MSEELNLENEKLEKNRKVRKIVTRILIFGSLFAALVFAAIMIYLNIYIYHYNKGNSFYEKEDYVSAISCYEKALNCHMPEKKECDVRVNLALAKMYTTKVKEMESFASMKEDEAQAAWEEIVTVGEECLDILSAQECAKEEGDGHDREAQKLYDEIKKLLDSQSSSSPDDNNDDNNDDGGGGGDNGGTGNENLDALNELMNQTDEVRDEYQEGMNEGGQDNSEWYGYFGDPW